MVEPARESLFRELVAYVEQRLVEAASLQGARRLRIEALSQAILERLERRDAAADGDPIPLVFICTHNSRRSHFGQVWAHVAALWYGVPHLCTYSGGTEATAFEPRAIAALRRAGLRVEARDATANPRYLVEFGPAVPGLSCFSKRYDASPNPPVGFVAVMTCAQADAECPVVLGATHRIALPYDDPKAFDGTPGEAGAYDATCAEIAREVLACFALVARALREDRRAGPGTPSRSGPGAG